MCGTCSVSPCVLLLIFSSSCGSSCYCDPLMLLSFCLSWSFIDFGFLAFLTALTAFGSPVVTVCLLFMSRFILKFHVFSSCALPHLMCQSNTGLIAPPASCFSVFDLLLLCWFLVSGISSNWIQMQMKTKTGVVEKQKLFIDFQKKHRNSLGNTKETGTLRMNAGKTNQMMANGKN